ncbi:von Willebrand factor A domain-containing protein 2-like isoform X2 [Oculina patagonica]
MLWSRVLVFCSVLFWMESGISAQEEILCTQSTDLGIILDSSDAISRNWLEVIDYANALVEFFNIGPKRSNVGIITYGTEAELAMDFNTFQGDNLSPENVQDLIDNLVPQGGERFIDKALILANERLFTKEAGMRVNDNNTLKIIILLTAGKQTQDQGSFTSLKEASQPLRDKGIKIYVVGVGSDEDIDEDELIEIAGTQENVLTTDLFEELVVLAEDVSKVICGIKIFERRKGVITIT